MAVPAPTAIASTHARSPCTTSLAGAEVRAVRSPGAAATRASADAAIFSRTNGRPRVMDVTNGSFSDAAWASQTPALVSTPCVRRYSRPLPDTAGFGSTMAATTRVTPASATATAQGPVRPV